MAMGCSSQLHSPLPVSLSLPLPLPLPLRPLSCSYSLPQLLSRHRYGSCTAGAARGKRGGLAKQVKAVLESEESHEPEEGKKEEDFKVLTAVQTTYNDIFILDTAKARLLILDPTHNIHSMVNKGSKWTGSYWDEFAALPPVVPRGPIGIFGLGGGTAAHLMLDLWASLQLEGWEIDEIETMEGGVLNIHIGDVLSPDAAIPGGYARIIVDLFAEGKVLPQLEEAATWFELYHKLMPNGRFMVNCGAGEDALSASDAVSQKDGSSVHGTWKLNATINALCKAFPGQVNWKKMPKSAGENYLALTGSLPDLKTWSMAVPDELKSSVNQWQTCNEHDR